MIQRSQLRIYLITWVAFGIACSLVLLSSALKSRSEPVTGLVIMWACLPLVFVFGLEAAAGVQPEMGWILWTAVGVVAVHAWLCLTTRSLDMWIALYGIHLTAAAAAVWGFHHLVRYVPE